MINFSNFFITPPKTFQFILQVVGKRNTDFVRFVTILPIFAAKRPDYTPPEAVQPSISINVDVNDFDNLADTDLTTSSPGVVVPSSYKEMLLREPSPIQSIHSDILI